MYKFYKEKRRAFTLVEIIVVVLIIGILTGLGVMLYSINTRDAQRTVVRSNLKTIESSISIYRVEHSGTYPSGNSDPIADDFTNHPISELLTEDTYTKPSNNYIYTAPTSSSDGSIVYNNGSVNETLILKYKE